MTNFFSICCQNHNSQMVISECLEQLMAAPSEYNFAFLYATDALANDLPELLTQCKNASSIKYWVGTLGTGVIAPYQEIYDMPAVSIMLAKFDPDEFEIFPLIKDTKDIDSIRWKNEFFQYFTVLHGNPFYQQTQELITAFSNSIEDSFLVGGLTSSQHNQYQIANDIFSDGISGVVFSEKIGVLTNLSQGCSPIGSKHTITGAKDNIITTLNQQPALEILMQDLNVNSLNELKQKANNVFTGLCIPHSDKSDYSVRNLIGIDAERKIIAINDYVSEDQQIIFCERNQASAIQDMQAMLSNLSNRLDGKPKGGLYISCLARGRSQFGAHSEEIKMIHEALGDFPLTGFFANGEIHHNKLYGYTGVLTLFI